MEMSYCPDSPTGENVFSLEYTNGPWYCFNNTKVKLLRVKKKKLKIVFCWLFCQTYFLCQIYLALKSTF